MSWLARSTSLNGIVTTVQCYGEKHVQCTVLYPLYNVKVQNLYNVHYCTFCTVQCNGVTSVHLTNLPDAIVYELYQLNIVSIVLAVHYMWQYSVYTGDVRFTFKCPVYSD